jgi:hypothetical protein
MAKIGRMRPLLTLLTVVASASLAVAQTPVITKISKVSTQQHQTIVITGSGFGTHAAYTGDSSFIAFEDETADPEWQAGYSLYNDTVTLIIERWEDTQIVLGGFSGAWGTYDYVLTKGDTGQVQVWNAQSGAGPATITTTIVGETTTTALTSSPNPSADGQAVTFTAQVASSTGAPPNGETVVFLDGKTPLGKGVLSGGIATFVTSRLEVGTTPVTAAYVGDSDFAGSESPAVNQVVQ